MISGNVCVNVYVVEGGRRGDETHRSRRCDSPYSPVCLFLGVDIAAEPFLMETSDPCSIFMGNAKAKAQTLALSVLVCMEMFKVFFIKNYFIFS